MKKLLLTFLFLIFIIGAFSAPFKFLPHKVVQPDGTVIECFLSGDEYFNWIHDKDGYSIIKGKDGYYYYAINAKEKIVASSYRVNSVDPFKAGIKKWAIISKDEYNKRREFYKIPTKNGIVNAPHTGDFNNLVIYIRFNGESEISTTREEYDDKLNPETGNTLKSYFKEVSYDQLTINSTHYPDCASPSTTNASYEDSHTRDYFQPYDATTNPTGYDGDSERTEREHQLLEDAITWVNENYPVDASLDIDGDGDGNVDNVCFMIQGDSDGWAELLWAHRWVLYTKTVYINGKRVYDYTFQPENQVSVRTLCHEMFHALGAPDLYHYYNGTHLSPAGYWDIMEYGSGHMGAYMKYKYADQKWVSEIPEITSDGTYTLNPLTSPENNCYKIASPYSSSEFFVVEYRTQEGTFESGLPGSGLIVYRINSNFDGNASYDGVSTFDEVYIYRPGGTTTANGSPDNAYFTSDESRTEITDNTDPSCFLSDGSLGGLNISNVTAAGETISFDVSFGNAGDPVNFNAEATSTQEIKLSWELNEDNNGILLAYNTENSFGTPESGVSYSQGESLDGGGEILYSGTSTSFIHQSLTAGQTYYYKIWSVNSSSEYSLGVTASESTPCSESLLPFNEDFSDGTLPSCWQNIDQASSGQVWSFENPGGRSLSSTSGSNGFAILDSDYYGSGNSQDAELISPLLDLSIYSGVTLNFEHYYNHYTGSLAELFYSIDGGNTWTIIDSWSSTIGSSATPSIFNQDISGYVAGKSEVYFKWKYQGSYGWYWIIDDISISGVSSGEPVALTKDASDILETSVNLNGTINANGNSITEIQFEYGTETGTYPNTLNATPSTASGSLNTSVEAEVSGLTSNTEYFYRVICKNETTTITGEEKSFTTETKPTVSISSEEEVTNDNPIDILVQFSESILSFEDEDITITNGTINSIDFVENNDYNVEVIPSADGEVTLKLLENVVEDIAGLGNVASDIFSVDYDGTKPTVIISSVVSDTTRENLVPVTFTFSEDISGFNLTDITVTNGTAGNFDSVNDKEYTADITPANGGVVAVQLLDSCVNDDAENMNDSSEVWAIYYSSPTGIEELSDLGIKLYPNPSSGLLKVEYKEMEEGDIEIFDYAGRIVYSGKINHNSIQTIDLRAEPKGIYIIRFNINHKQVSSKLLIQ